MHMPRTITDIVPPSRRRALENAEITQPDVATDIPPTSVPPSDRPTMNDFKRPKKGFPYGVALAAVVIVAVSVGAMYAFAGAKVEITPTISTTAISGEFSATPSVGDLPFESVSVEKVVTLSLPAEGTQTANDPAQGTVTIYNTQTKTQELIKNTRFETPDGLIFRIHESVVVPAGSTAAPGSLDVTVYADAAGESYNVGPTTFTLPGLSGSALFDQVYARSTASMMGGFVGQRPSVSAATREAKLAEMNATLEGDLYAAINEKVPGDYVLVPGAAVLSYVAQPDQAGSGGTVTISTKGQATAIIFPKGSLAKAIAYKTLGTYLGEPVTLRDAAALRLTPMEGTVFAPGAETLSFTLTGEASVLWVVDEAKIRGAVAGKTRDAARTILAGLPEVDDGKLVLRPFWEGSLPQNPEKIEVKVMEGAANR